LFSRCVEVLRNIEAGCAEEGLAPCPFEPPFLK
jgi:hypothetical protein